MPERIPACDSRTDGRTGEQTHILHRPRRRAVKRQGGQRTSHGAPNTGANCEAVHGCLGRLFLGPFVSQTL